MKIDRDFSTQGPTAAQTIPQGIQQLVQDFQVDFKEWIDDVKAELQGVTDPDEAEVIRYKMETPISRISGVAGRDLLFAAEGDSITQAIRNAKTDKERHTIAVEAYCNSDAGHAMVAAKNATIWTVSFPYGTHQPMQGFLTDLPADKKVTFNVICTPSSHYGREESDAELRKRTPAPGTMRANYESNARTNPYRARILYQAPNGKETELTSVDFKVKDPTKPEYATMSPEMTIDLSKMKGGKIILEGWCTLSLGVLGYEETRRTELALL